MPTDDDLQEECDRLTAQLERMRQHTCCAYCGFEVRMDQGGSLIAEHIRACPHHPMRAVEARLSEREALLAALEKDLRQVGRECCSHAFGPQCLQWADRIKGELGGRGT